MNPRICIAAGAMLTGFFISSQVTAQVREKDVRAHMEFLASDALRGRGSMTNDEHVAAEYIASQLRQFNIDPAGEVGPDGKPGYLQRVNIETYTFADPPKLTITSEEITWTHGKEIIVIRASQYSVRGPLEFVRDGKTPSKGGIAFFESAGSDNVGSLRSAMRSARSSGAAAILLETPASAEAYAASLAKRMPEFMSRDSGTTMIVFVDHRAAQRLAHVSQGSMVTIGASEGPTRVDHTWNVVGVLRGTDPTLGKQVISLSAHMDHLGVRRGAESDSIYNGADDDASGTTAVLELGRQLGAGAQPRRTVYIALFGSEERGGFGAQYFVKTLPFPLSDFVADIQFEMIGRPDSAVDANALWLTGYERSNLGPELAKHGAYLVADPHPEQNFFQRSDNYTLARMGVVAHTVSSYGLHQEYHRATDDIAHIDFGHMTRSIDSMVKPIKWLVNSDFVPTWAEGMKP